MMHGYVDRQINKGGRDEVNIKMGLDKVKGSDDGGV